MLHASTVFTRFRYFLREMLYTSLNIELEECGSVWKHVAFLLVCLYNRGSVLEACGCESFGLKMWPYSHSVTAICYFSTRFHTLPAVNGEMQGKKPKMLHASTVFTRFHYFLREMLYTSLNSELEECGSVWKHVAFLLVCLYNLSLIHI